MPTPLPARPTLDEQLEALLSSVPPLPPVAAQGPPPLIPLVYRPVPRARRARSPSPVSLRTLPDRADTAPPTEYPGDWRPRLRGPKRREPRQQLGDRDATSIMTDAPTEYTAATEPGTSAPSRSARTRRSHRDEGPDINFEARLRELRRGRRGGDGVMNYEMGSRPSTAVSVASTINESIADLLLPSQIYHKERLLWILNSKPLITGSVGLSQLARRGLLIMLFLAQTGAPPPVSQDSAIPPPPTLGVPPVRRLKPTGRSILMIFVGRHRDPAAERDDGRSSGQSLYFGTSFGSR
jgi:hypothetical protein